MTRSVKFCRGALLPQPKNTEAGRIKSFRRLSMEQVKDDPVARYSRIGLWALPIFAFLLGVGTITHQPPPETDLAGWSRYVTTDEFLASHLIASIGGAVFGAIGAIALGLVLMRRGSVRLGLAGLLTGVSGNILITSVFGVAAYTQPAVGRFYLAGHHDLAQGLYYDATQPPALVVVALVSIVLLSASFIVFGAAVARMAGLPRIAGIGLAVSIVLFAVIGFVLDDWIQTVGSTLMTICTVWIVLALNGRRDTASQPMADLARAV
jgi:hypothetical protein